MDTKQMINHVRRLYDEVYTNFDGDVCKELVAKNLKLHDPSIPNGVGGLDKFIETEKKYSTAFPDKSAHIYDIFAIDNKVVVLWTCRGTHEGKLQGVSPTHNKFNIKGCSVYQFSNGKISEIWQSWDRLALLEQLGILEPEAVLH
jgi:steroid delta-isomerase-like uncharacterized protein